jgi:hypothetical protein
MRLYRSNNASKNGEWIVANNEEEALEMALEYNKNRKAGCWKVNDVTDDNFRGIYGKSLRKVLSLGKVGIAFIVIVSDYRRGWRVYDWKNRIEYKDDGSSIIH